MRRWAEGLVIVGGREMDLSVARSRFSDYRDGCHDRIAAILVTSDQGAGDLRCDDESLR